jgi:hypothetical protein
VVYKNLVRSIRKFLSADFRLFVAGPSRKEIKSNLPSLLRQYCSSRFVKEIKSFGLTLEELTLLVGSVIEPKHLLSSGLNSTDRHRVQTIFDYLYKFSLQKLKHMIDDLPMMVLFCRYLEMAGTEPTTRSLIDLLAFREASILMLKNCKHLELLAKFFDFQKMFGGKHKTRSEKKRR